MIIRQDPNESQDWRLSQDAKVAAAWLRAWPSNGFEVERLRADVLYPRAHMYRVLRELIEVGYVRRELKVVPPIPGRRVVYRIAHDKLGGA